MLCLSVQNNLLSDGHLTIVGDFTNLLKLNIDQKPITDLGQQHLRNNTKLERLTLYNTNITKNSLAFLIELHGLKNIYVWDTGITAADILYLTWIRRDLLISLLGYKILS